VSEQTKNALKYKAQVSAVYTEKAKTKEFKLERQKAKKIKKSRGASSKRNKHRWGCGCKNSDCSNGRCQCVKDDRSCGDNCECKDTGLCFNHEERGIQNRETFKKKRENKGKGTLKKRQQDELSSESESKEKLVKKRKIIILTSSKESE
jgi:hypothetical protein